MAFVAGVFSLLDVLLAMPMTEIVAALSLDLDVVMALLDRAGPLGDLLKLVERHDRQPGAGRHLPRNLLGSAVAGLPLGDPGEQEYLTDARATRLRFPEHSAALCDAVLRLRGTPSPKNWDASSAP
jgi:hypothetical protein